MMGTNGMTTAQAPHNPQFIHKRHHQELSNYYRGDDGYFSSGSSASDYTDDDASFGSFFCQRQQKRRGSGGRDSAGCLSAFAAPPATTKVISEDITEGQKLIVEELNKLTFQERENAYSDVHGVSGEDDEPPQFVASKLHELQIQIDHHIPDEGKLEYLEAYAMSPQYCNNRRLRLAFLRACRFDASDAAQRITLHFRMKKEYFGSAKLVQDITLDDLDEEDKRTLYSGGFYFFRNCKDRAGRTILFNLMRSVKYESPHKSVRAFWYMDMNTILGDETTQKKGIVVIAYNVGPHALQHFDMEHRRRVVQLVSCLPFRLTALHTCYSDPALTPYLSGIQKKFHKDIMVRYRTHYGSHTECQYALMQFGIPASILPMDAEGNLKQEMFARQMERLVLDHFTIEEEYADDPFDDSEDHHAAVNEDDEFDKDIAELVAPVPVDENCNGHMNAMNIMPSAFMVANDPGAIPNAMNGNATMLPIQQNAQSNAVTTTTSDAKNTKPSNGSKANGKSKPKLIKTSDLVREVNPTDVLFGRGRPIQSHPGNIKFLSILDEHRFAYDSARNDEKKAISAEVVRIVKTSNGRFLKQGKQGKPWEEASDEEARLKVSNAFRTRRHLAKKIASN